MESLQAQLGQVREELLGTMGNLEKEKHRAQTLQTLVATSSRQENYVLKLVRKIFCQSFFVNLFCYMHLFSGKREKL